YTQTGAIGSMHVEVRTAGDPEAALPVLQKQLRSLAPDVAMLQPATQRAQFRESIYRERLVADLAFCFGGLGVLLVASGLYGSIAYSVHRRTAELGVRLAVGAQPRTLLWMILREGMAIAGIGLGLGLPLAFVAARSLSSLLYGLGPHDPLTASLAI